MPRHGGGEASALGRIPRHRSPFALVRRAGSVSHPDLLAIIDRRRPLQREEDGRRELEPSGIAAQPRRHALLIVVGEKRSVCAARRISARDRIEHRGDGAGGAAGHAAHHGVREREVEQQRKTARRRPEVRRDRLAIRPRLADDHRVRIRRKDAGSPISQAGVRFRPVLLESRSVLDEIADRVEPEAIHPARQPTPRDGIHLGADRGIAPVEVRHPAPEHGVVPGAGATDLIPSRPGTPRPARVRRGPDVPVAV